MFDELDDTRPFTPTETFRTAVLRRSRSQRRRRNALRVGGATCAAAVLVPSAFALYEYHRLDDVHRIAIPNVGDGLPALGPSSDGGPIPVAPSSMPATTTGSAASTGATASPDTAA